MSEQVALRGDLSGNREAGKQHGHTFFNSVMETFNNNTFFWGTIVTVQDFVVPFLSAYTNLGAGVRTGC